MAFMESWQHLVLSCLGRNAATRRSSDSCVESEAPSSGERFLPFRFLCKWRSATVDATEFGGCQRRRRQLWVGEREPSVLAA